ncbi:hypothetical protein [Agrobacterium genomosp. 2]|uniref:Uncharacterized protein n=1 Tax=Agrobacterium genomosp. 2 str. CFBP 5494 TaxID=1183436 RepID=A0A9W5AYX5_9HYPH|nr:hypothetical protein [Agrobacterium genomosp. 2]CUW87450.1 hypothetical protein AGR2A_Cc120051 [Agrobacterium genomosp. 2 str. CFBP 5494]
MADNNMPSGEILELIKGQARLETKLDQFFSTQAAMKIELDSLKADIGSVKSDVAEIKAQRRATAAYVAALSTAAGVFWIFVGEKVKKIFGA